MKNTLENYFKEKSPEITIFSKTNLAASIKDFAPTTDAFKKSEYSLKPKNSILKEAITQNLNKIATDSKESFKLIYPYIIAEPIVEEKIKEFYNSQGYDFQGKISENKNPVLRFATKDENLKVVYSTENNTATIQVQEEFKKKINSYA